MVPSMDSTLRDILSDVHKSRLSTSKLHFWTCWGPRELIGLKFPRVPWLFMTTVCLCIPPRCAFYWPEHSRHARSRGTVLSCWWTNTDESLQIEYVWVNNLFYSATRFMPHHYIRKRHGQSVKCYSFLCVSSFIPRRKINQTHHSPRTATTLFAVSCKSDRVWWFNGCLTIWF